MTYTYALLEVSPAAHAEIREKLQAAGYEHAFHREDGREVIDMHGIGVVAALLPTLRANADLQLCVLTNAVEDLDEEIAALTAKRAAAWVAMTAKLPPA